MPKASRWEKIKAANLWAAVVADLLQNFASRPKMSNGPSRKTSVYYYLSWCEILLPQINRLSQSTLKFEANENHHTIFSFL